MVTPRPPFRVRILIGSESKRAEGSARKTSIMKKHFFFFPLVFLFASLSASAGALNWLVTGIRAPGTEELAGGGYANDGAALIGAYAIVLDVTDMPDGWGSLDTSDSNWKAVLAADLASQLSGGFDPFDPSADRSKFQLSGASFGTGANTMPVTWSDTAHEYSGETRNFLAIIFTAGTVDDLQQFLITDVQSVMFPATPPGGNVLAKFDLSEMDRWYDIVPEPASAALLALGAAALALRRRKMPASPKTSVHPSPSSDAV
jgi:hypothetical protein